MAKKNAIGLTASSVFPYMGHGIMFIKYAESTTDASLPALALYSFRKIVEGHLGRTHFKGKSLPIVFSDNRKQMFSIEQWRAGGYDCEYPFAFVEISSLTGDLQDKSVIGNPKMTLKRHGSGYGAVTNATVLKNFMIDLQFDLTLHFQTDDPMSAVAFASDIIVMQKADVFTSMVKDDYGERLLTVEADTTISWPKPATEDGAAPGVFDLEVPFRLRFKAGSQKHVPKINNEGRVTLGVDTPGDST